MDEKHQNRLIHETSPYLLQHAHNPVDWYPWGDEALRRARDEDKPIFLSIGYSACHWCHVMERESFEDESVAAYLNEHFISVKVDREERPDLDDIYMKFVQSLTGSGGWPMSVWMTADLRPFFGGTYFPPDNRYGRASFMQVLDWVVRAWGGNRSQFLEQAGKFVDFLAAREADDVTGDVDRKDLEASFLSLEQSFDDEWGGFGQAPKFPHAMDIRLCLRHFKRTGNDRARHLAIHTLDCMARGGIYDHIGGGFARYSTDEKWLIPHFEKMLYDNAMLVPAYLDAYVLTGEERHARVVRETCDFVLREMMTPEGGFGSTLDADSEGVEGKFYAWNPEQLREVLGHERGTWAANWFGVTDHGNFEHGQSALWRPDPADEVASRLGVDVDTLAAAMDEASAALFEARAKRIRPGYDDKVLVSWNGLMISAMAQAYQVLGETRYLDAARGAARYILDSMRQPDGRLFATAREGKAHLNAYLDDYAFLMAGLLDLYESDFDASFVEQAIALERIVQDQFHDAERGGYYNTGRDHEKLLVRTKSQHDQATPAGSGVMALNLLRLAALTGDGDYRLRAESTIRSLGKLIDSMPAAFSQIMHAIDWIEVGGVEVVIAGERDGKPVAEMLNAIRGVFRPQRVIALADPGATSGSLPLLEGKDAPAGEARGYLCRDFACQVPAVDPWTLREQLATS